MGIIRTNKNTDYTVINNTGIKDSNLSWKAKGLLAYLLSLPDDWEVYIKELVRHAKDGKDGTASGVEELFKNGYVTKEVIRDKEGHFKGYEYNIYETKKTPKSENPKSENPKSENPKLLNTNSNKVLNEQNTNSTKKNLNKKNSFRSWTEKEFQESINEAYKKLKESGKYNDVLCTEAAELFFNYWTEPDGNGTPKYQMKQNKTWDTQRRFITWLKNRREIQNRYKSNPGSQNKADSAIHRLVSLSGSVKITEKEAQKVLQYAPEVPKHDKEIKKAKDILLNTKFRNKVDKLIFLSEIKSIFSMYSGQVVKGEIGDFAITEKSYRKRPKKILLDESERQEIYKAQEEWKRSVSVRQTKIRIMPTPKYLNDLVESENMEKQFRNSIEYEYYSKPGEAAEMLPC